MCGPSLCFWNESDYRTCIIHVLHVTRVTMILSDSPSCLCVLPKQTLVEPKMVASLEASEERRRRTSYTAVMAASLCPSPISPSHQPVDLPWVLALSAYYTVDLTAVTDVAKKIWAPVVCKPLQPEKGHFSGFCPSTASRLLYILVSVRRRGGEQ